jgi:hypothetical protein
VGHIICCLIISSLFLSPSLACLSSFHLRRFYSLSLLYCDSTFIMRPMLIRKAERVFALYSAFSPTVFAGITCYGPNQQPLTLYDYLPCFANETGACCSNEDNCLSNGLCFNSGGNNLLSQGGCTNESFDIPGCAKICSGPFISLSNALSSIAMPPLKTDLRNLR